jgi:DNA-binding transcriptional ArsR family regulator
VDAWSWAVAFLAGALVVPAISWPPGRSRVVLAREMSEPLEELPPEQRTAITDEQLLRHLAGAGTCTVRQLAGEIETPKSTVARGLARLRAAGLVRLDASGWQAA